VRWYATQAGWKPVSGVNRPVIVLNHPSDDLTQIQIPTAGSDKEIVYLMREAVERLAAAEHRSSREILFDLAVPTADKLRFRVQSREAEGGSLPLEEGLGLWTGGRDSILAAACSAYQPQAYFPRQSFSVAQNFLRRCRMAPSEPGSYVATIIAPVPPELTPSLLPEPEAETEANPVNELIGEPYERRVTLLLMLGLQTIQAAIERGDTGFLLHETSRGVSANLCEALATMSPSDTQATLHISTSWSPSRSRVPKAIKPRISFAQSEFMIIREVGRTLRASMEPRRERVEGPIISLHAEPASLFEDFKGKVFIRTLINGKSARVRVELNEPDYVAACDAHRDRCRVAVSGILQREAEAKQYDLLHPQRFEVLDTDMDSE
jgi:hypothetical protein